MQPRGGNPHSKLPGPPHTQTVDEARSKAEQQHEERVRSMMEAHRTRVKELEDRVAAQQEILNGQKQQLQTIYQAGAGGRLPKLGVPLGTGAGDALHASAEQRLIAAEALNAQLEADLKEARAALLIAQQHLAVFTGEGGGDGPGEAALLAARTASARRSRAGDDTRDEFSRFEMDRLQQLVADRDREVSELKAELSLVEASRDEPGAEAKALAAQLASTELALRVAQERMATLEAAAVMAQEGRAQGTCF